MPKIELEGDWFKLSNRLTVMISGMQAQVTPLVRYEADIAHMKMRITAPVDTGFMRDHIIKNDVPNGAEIESQAHYSGYVEFGTSRMSAQPFFRPALITLWSRFKRKLERLLAGK